MLAKSHDCVKLRFAGSSCQFAAFGPVPWQILSLSKADFCAGSGAFFEMKQLKFRYRVTLA